MTQSDIIRLAREVGLTIGTNISGITLVGSPAAVGLAHITLDEIRQFAELVAAAEREACAALCFQMWNEWMDNESISELNRPDAEDCAHAIRKRGLDNLNKEAEKNGEEL
jgi:hypothetical protein